MRLQWAIALAAVCLVVAIGALAYGAGKASAPEVIQAQQFELVDEGKVLAVLGLRGVNLTPGRVVIVGPDEKVESEGSLALPDGRVALPAHMAKLPFLELRDEEGRTRVEIAVEARGEPTMRLRDEDGRVTYVVPPVHGVQMLAE